MTTFTEQLQDLDACPEAIEWVNGRSLRKCWQVADRGDWMLWLAGGVDIDRKVLVLAACDCAALALKHVPEGEDRPRKAIETARAWAEGRATAQEVRDAAAHADHAVNAADYAARAANAVNAADHAVNVVAHAGHADHAANAAANAVAHAANAAHAAHTVNAANALYAVYAATLKQCAKLVRKRIPVEMIEEALSEVSSDDTD